MSNTRELSRTDFLDKLGKEEVYLLNDWEDMAVRVSPDDQGIFVKFKGREEFPAVHGSKVVADAILEQALMTKDEYEKY